MLTAIKNKLHNIAIHKTRTMLLTMSDRQLEDVGISRALLVQGVKQWPWREDLTTQNVSQPRVEQPGKFKAAQISKAIRELSDMSDSQLRDIGIDRGSIRHAAKHGVPDRGPKQAA